MTFDHPLRAAGALILAAAVVAAIVALARRRSGAHVTYSNLAFMLQATGSPAWIERALLASWCVGVVLCALAAGGPRLPLPVAVRDGYVFICLDTSGSMSSTDVTPTRLQAAVAAARSFVEASPPGTRIGIITFSSQAALLAPLTADRTQVSGALDQVPAPNGGTAIGDALALAARNFPPQGHRVAILITDGVNNAGADPLTAAQQLGANHIPIFTIGIGTDNGSIIPGTAQAATIDEDALRSYAQVSGGAYARADSAPALRAALERLGRVTAVAWKKVDASLKAAIAGAAVMVLTLLVGLGVGRFP